MMNPYGQSVQYNRRDEHLKITLILPIFFICTNSAPIYSDTEIDSIFPPTSALKFMKKFGYLEAGTPDSEALYTASAIVDAVKTLQKFGNIPISGHFDNDTLKLMESPRCGVADVVRHQGRRKKRFIIGSEGWKKRDITYFIANWSPKLGEEAIIDEMSRAFDAWRGYSRLQFRQVDDPNADIVVAFGRGPHGDGYPFDGMGNILAHAFFPYEMGSYGGDIHFDDDEDWKIRPLDPYEGTDFFTVAVHELGHSLGLSHSPIPSSIMFPYYRGHTPNFQLDYDDVLGMYQLYISRQLEGDKSTTTTERSTTETDTVEFTTRYSETKLDDDDDEEDDDSRTTGLDQETTTHYTILETSTMNHSTTVTESYHGVTFIGDFETVDEHRRHETNNDIPDVNMSTVPDICEGSFDAMSVFRDELFIFKGKYVWRLVKRGNIEGGYPVKFHQLFYGLPQNITRIDAAYQRENDANIILFTGNKYWIYNGDKFTSDSPRPLTDYGISVEVDKIDATQVWAKNGKTYLYSGDQFWRFDETSRTLDSGYPNYMQRWRGVPTNIDTAMTWIDGKTYFFKEKLFWKFDNFLIKTDKRYPLPAPQYWIGCPELLDTV